MPVRIQKMTSRSRKKVFCKDCQAYIRKREISGVRWACKHMLDINYSQQYMVYARNVGFFCGYYQAKRGRIIALIMTALVIGASVAGKVGGLWNF